MSHTPTDCQRWNGAHDDDGYGRVMRDGKWCGAHRVAWEAKYGPIPDGMVIDHLCRVRDCVNTAHMEVVTPSTNTLRGEGPAAINARKTHCIKGHPLSGDNLMVRPNGRRWCRECGRQRWRIYRLRKIEEGTWTST